MISRAPELIFGATDYTTNIDVWSAGCVFAELMLGQVNLLKLVFVFVVHICICCSYLYLLFIFVFADLSVPAHLPRRQWGRPAGRNHQGHFFVNMFFLCCFYLELFLNHFLQVLGTPTREQIKEMNPNYTEFKFPQIKAHPWPKVDYQIFRWNIFKRVY